ncbi:MAG TPA: molybdopterin-dependent oxidoreductase, partial [Planctomycetota bacterium]|nr:molybdopterin-dependent oxidoreductase [Planctomycetota bacterium]
MTQHEAHTDRRNFLLAAGAAAGGLFLAGCGKKEDPFHLEKPPINSSTRRGEEVFVTTACGQCAAGCSIRARQVEGRLVKLESNPACPLNNGGIGPRGLAGIQVVYDPDRIHQPMLRDGPRGSAQFKPITWEAAIEILAKRLQSLRDMGAAHRTAILCGRERGMMVDLWQRFARSIGTPNTFDGFSSGNAASAQAFELISGNREIPAYDWRRAQYVLSLDSGLMESSCQSVFFARAQAQQRHSRAHSRAKIVHCGQAMTRTGINADEVVMLKPGSCGVFALGICRILVQEELYDKAYVAEHCHGFETWKDETGVEHPGFREVVDRYTPAYVAEQCGVTEKALTRIAHEMPQTRPCFAITGPEATLAPNGLQTAWATLALNALLGAIHRPGGVMMQLAAPMPAWDTTEPDEIAKTGLEQPRLDGAGRMAYPLATSVIEALPEALISGLPYSIDTLLLYYSNPLYSKINPARWQSALGKVPFIVTFSPFLDETATELADLILPDATYLERWEDAAPAPATGYAVFGIRQPVTMESVHQTMPTGDVLLAVAKKMGGSVAQAFPWKDFKDCMLKRIIGIYKAKRGSIVEANGGAFLTKLYQAGFWSDDSYPFEDWKTVVKTPSGKLELFSLALQKKLVDFATQNNRPIDQVLRDLQLPGDLDHAC